MHAPAITSTAHSHPNGTAHYNVLVGGIRGAADQEMMRQFWGYAGGDAVGYLNEQAPRGRVFFQNTTHDAYRMYQRDGRLAPTVRHGSLGNSDYGMIHHQMAFRPLEAKLWREYGTRNPVFVSHHDGVPVLRLYQNQKRKGRRSR